MLDRPIVLLLAAHITPFAARTASPVSVHRGGVLRGVGGTIVFRAMLPI